MGGNKSINGLTGVLIAILAITGFTPITSSAVAVWSDDFDDRDYDDWTVLDGAFSAENQCLCPNGSDEYHSIQHNSPNAYGSWIFDLYFNSSAGGGETTIFSFIADELVDGNVDTGHLGQKIPLNGYTLETSRDTYGIPDQYVRWHRFDNGIQRRYRDTRLPYLFGWNNITIHRNQTGFFEIYINENLEFEVEDNTHTTSGVFSWSTKLGHSIDNVVITGPSTIALDLLLIGGGAAVAVVIIAIVVYIRRR
jgi:hypothetical protein